MAILVQHNKLPENKSIKRKHQDPNNVNADVMMFNNKKNKKQKKNKQELLVVKAGDQHPDDVNEDRLTNLPEPIILNILSLLDNHKEVVRTSVLSKSWVSLWTWIPVLTFDSCGTKLRKFDKIVTKVLGNKSVKLNKLTFNRGGSTSAKILNTVFGYAFSNGVKEVEATINGSRNYAWPDCLHSTSSDSLTHLKLISSNKTISCEFLGQRSAGLFKNLTNLYLQNASILDPDPFSGFPALEKLTLYECWFKRTLNVRASQLSALTINDQNDCCTLDRCQLLTPKLRVFKFQSFSTIPVFVTPQALPVLDEFVFDHRGSSSSLNEKQTFHRAISIMQTFHNAKSLTISESIIELLSNFSKKMVTQCSPFWGLKFLKLDQDVFDEIPSEVIDYLLQCSVDAKVSRVKLYKGISARKCKKRCYRCYR
uniref:F-box/LRR-repeat protein At3g26922-like n=1 Tax=Erigeron canadensis TaxID=72917 RepID=UPI001CB9836C|nr:F-box/LRR-repeat protein At3g26922-like [Erigeron canadensis]